jgi:hypothetical protein
VPADDRLEHTLDRIRGGVAGGHAQRRIGKRPISSNPRHDHGSGERRHEHVGPSQRLEQVGGTVGAGALTPRHGVAHGCVERGGDDDQRAAHEPPARG